jgi:hypothetical protein
MTVSWSGVVGRAGQRFTQLGDRAMSDDPDIDLGHVQGGGYDLVVDVFEVEQEHLLFSQRADPEHGRGYFLVGAPSEYLHGGRRLVRRKLGAGSVIVERLALAALQRPTRAQNLDAEEPEQVAAECALKLKSSSLPDECEEGLLGCILGIGSRKIPAGPRHHPAQMSLHERLECTRVPMSEGCQQRFIRLHPLGADCTQRSGRWRHDRDSSSVQAVLQR